MLENLRVTSHTYRFYSMYYGGATWVPTAGVPKGC